MKDKLDEKIDMFLKQDFADGFEDEVGSLVNGGQEVVQYYGGILCPQGQPLRNCIAIQESRQILPR